MNLSRTMLIGGALAVVAVLLFLGLWWLLGALGASQTARLFTALCVPPLVILGLVALVALTRRGQSGDAG
ncbi:MAG: hypothetical protein JNL34_03340 [Anaerolineae bacterium]|nr:hypothetical protein [Anaerolineae bacterium]